MDSGAFLNAIRRGDTENVALMLQANPMLMQIYAEGGMSPVLLASYHKHTPVVQLLLSYNPPLNFYEAAATGALETLLLWLKEKPHLLNSYAPDGFTALGLACALGQAKIVDILLEYGANPNIGANNALLIFPLHAAIAGAYTGITKALLAAGADVHVTEQAQYTPLMEAAEAGQIELVQLLLAAGANCLAQNEYGQTAADLASEAGFDAIVQILTPAL